MTAGSSAHQDTMMTFAHMMLHLLYAVQITFDMLKEMRLLATRALCQIVPQPCLGDLLWVDI